jgi:RNA polymerase sigma-70 factor (ECF subfamily)
MRAVAGRDPATVVELVERAAPEVYRYAVRLTGGDRALAEDLVQDACVDLVRVDRSGGAAELGVGWLIVVVRRRYLDHLRRTDRDTRRVDRATAGDELITAPDWASVRGGDALTCLGLLSADQRAALVLRYVDDLPVAEVAELMDRTVAATESLLARARRELARHVEEVRHG